MEIQCSVHEIPEEVLLLRAKCLQEVLQKPFVHLGIKLFTISGIVFIGDHEYLNEESQVQLGSTSQRCPRCLKGNI